MDLQDKLRNLENATRLDRITAERNDAALRFFLILININITIY